MWWGSAVGPLRAPQKFQVNAGTRLNAERWAICANRYLGFSICASAIRSFPPNGRTSTMPATSPRTVKRRTLAYLNYGGGGRRDHGCLRHVDSAALAQLSRSPGRKIRRRLTKQTGLLESRGRPCNTSTPRCRRPRPPGNLFLSVTTPGQSAVTTWAAPHFKDGAPSKRDRGKEVCRRCRSASSTTRGSAG